MPPSNKWLSPSLSPGQYERGLSPYKREPGDCGVLCCVLEEKAGLKDKVCFEITGSNLDKKDVFSESDPYFTISRVNADGSDTVVYRSEWIKVGNLVVFNI